MAPSTSRHFGFVFDKNSVMEMTGFLRRYQFRKLRIQNVFHPHENQKPAFSNSSDLKRVFEKLRFRDRLAWMVGQNIEIKVLSLIFTAKGGQGPNGRLISRKIVARCTVYITFIHYPDVLTLFWKCVNPISTKVLNTFDTSIIYRYFLWL